MYEWERAASLLSAGVISACLVWGCSPGSADDNRLTSKNPTVTPIAPRAADAEWRTPAKDDANTRFSTLTDITASNVAQLKPSFSFSTGVLRGHESAPLVIGSTMYILTPYPNLLYALDLKQPGAPARWKYQPHPASASQGAACCDVVNRGATYSDGRIFFNTLDGYAVAVDAATGKEQWKVKLADFNSGETLTMAPFVAKDKVLVGNSGGEFGVRGWLAALDAQTGKVLWKAYSTGPDSEVLIGSEFQPFYPQDRGKDLGVRTWPSGTWQTGGGNVWGFISYDRALNLIYYGTGNPGPWNPEQRPGDNKWTSGIFARDVDTGRARWFYQFSPHDTFDYDGINENVLAEIEVSGAPRKVLIHPDRNGYVYVLDRTSGEVISAQAYGHITTSTGVDIKTGRLLYAAEKQPRAGVVIRDICPAAPGAKDWNPSAYSPQTGLLIPGFAGSKANIGPPLERYATRTYIAGVLTNTPDNLVRWIQDPPAVDPLTAMPNLGVAAPSARDMASYLYAN